MIQSKFEDGTLTLKVVDGTRIDTTNAPVAEADVNKAIEANSGIKSVVVDFERLEYISSVGLRLILKIKKQFPDTKVINTSSEVYDIFDMTGFSEMMTVEKAYRKFSVDGCEVIGEGAKGIVYRYNGDTIVKVYKNNDCLDDIQKERDLARKAFVLGIPTAISYDVVKVGDKFGSVFELLDAKSLSKIISEHLDEVPKYAKIYADLLKQIHSTMVKEDDMPSIKYLPRKWINGCKGFLPEDEWNKLNDMIEKTPDTLNMIHGDYHTNNIMIQNGEVLLIDMDTLSHGYPIFELANTYITYVGFGEVDPKNVENFIGVPYASAVEIWKNFLVEYLGTTNEARLKEVEEKAALLAYARLLSRTPRMDYTDDFKKYVIDYAKGKISELLKKIDTLEF